MNIASPFNPLSDADLMSELMFSRLLMHLTLCTLTITAIVEKAYGLAGFLIAAVTFNAFVASIRAGVWSKQRV